MGTSRSDYFSVIFILLVSLACASLGALNSQTKQFILDLHNEARGGIGAPNMRKMGWSEDLAAIAEDTASTCSRDPTPLSVLIPAVNSQYSWIVENRHTVTNETDIQTGLGKAFQCWLDGSSCTTNEIRFDEIAYPDSYLIGCGAHYFPPAPLCRNFGTGVRIICYYAPGAPESYSTRVGEPCSSCPDEAPLCDSQLCVPPDDRPLPSVPEDNDEDNTDGITPRVTSISPGYSSFGGGTLISINGEGFADDQFSVADDPNVGNRVTLYNGNLRLPCVVERYYTTPERIVCRTSPSPDQVQRTFTLEVTVNGKELSEFDGASYCGGSCRITYAYSYTPIISSISPHAKIPGDEDQESVSINGKVFSYKVAETQELNEDDEDRNLQIVDRMLVGGELCDPYVEGSDSGSSNGTEERSIYGGNVDTNGNGYVSCRPDTVRIDSMNVSVVLSEYGTSIIQKDDYALDNKFRKYIFQTHPDIVSVEPKTGSPTGGTLITVRGKHFTYPLDDIKVDISGIPCEIVSHNSTVIQCITGPAPPLSEVYPGGRGLAREVWLDNYNSNPDTIKSRQYGYPDPSYKWTVQERFYRATGYEPEFGEETNFQQRYTGFFVPPVTATYTFNLYSDDLMDVFLSSDTTRANADLIAYTNEWTRNSWNYYPTQLSEPINLIGGQAYYLEALQTQGIGPWQIGLGAKIHNLTWTDDYALADHEEQQIRIRSSAFKETQLITVTSQPKIQQITLNLNNDGTIQFTLSFKDVSTTTFTQSTWRSTIENTLNGLSTIQAIGSVEVEREKTSDHVILTVTFVSNEVTLDDIIVSNYTTHESVILQQPQSNAGTGFTITYGSRTSEPVNGTTSADDMEIALYGLITTECSVSNEGNVHYYDNYESSALSVQYGGLFDNFERSYCGRFSIKNPRFLYRPVRGYSLFSVNSFQNRYICFNVRGKIPNSIIGFRMKYSYTSNRWRRLNNIQSTYSNDEWQNICVDVFDEFDKLLGPPLNGISFTIDYIYLDYPEAGEDFWIDEFRITSSSLPTVTQLKMAARPNNVPIDSISVTKKSVDLICPDDDNVLTDCQLQIPFTVKYTVENCVHGIPLMTTPSSSHVTVTRLYAGSPPVGGTFTVSFEGNTVTGLSSMIEEDELEDKLEESFGGVFDVDRSGSCHGYIWNIRWENRGGDLPMMSADESGLTGDSPTIEVNPVTDGGVWLRPFRGDMLRLPELTPQVQVTVNGIPASCRSRNCSFMFPEDQIATISSVSPSMGGQDGTPITIEGTGFPTDTHSLTVSIGDKDCPVQSTNTTHIVCTPSQNVAGVYPVKVLVTGSGFALHPSNKTAVTFEYSIVVSDIQSDKGSVFGGNTVMFHGAGFPDLSTDYNDSHNKPHGHFLHSDVYILFDDLPCFIKSSNFSMLSCVPQPHEEDTVNITIQINTVMLELQDAYQYSVNHTAVVTMVTPSMGGVSGGDTVTINGQNFDDDVMVMIGDGSCEIQSSTSNTIVCTTSTHQPGSFNVIVTSRKFGAASIHPSMLNSEDFELLQIPFDVFLEMEDEPRMLSNMSVHSIIQFPTFTYQLLVTSLTPSTGSLAGGTEVTITGKGFDNSVVVTATATDQSCDISHVSYEEIKCTMPTTVKTHTIMNTGIHPELGPYFGWEPSEITIKSGSKVTWEWSGSVIGQSFEVHQVGSLDSNTRIGFQSESSMDGSFSYVFTEPGTYFYATDVSSNLFPMSGEIVVEPNEDIVTEVQVTVGNFTAVYNVSFSDAESIGSGMTTSECLSWEAVVSDRVLTEPPVFIYSKCSTPVVREIQSDYSTLSSDFQIIGQNLGANVNYTSASFGEVTCHVSELMDSSLICNLDKQAQPQPYMPLPLKLKVHNLGYALLLGDGMLNRSVQLNPSVTSVEPASGSVFGGNNVTIMGESFSTEHTMVSFGIGGSQCVITSVTYNTIVCEVPSSGYGLDKNTTVNVTVYNSVDNRQAVVHEAVEYAYSTDYTPMVVMVSPKTVSSSDPTVVTITGELLTGDSIVTIGTSHHCMNVMEVDSESIRCSLEPIPGATYSLNVFVPEYGYASVSTDDRITSQLRADAVNPSAGSIRGGTTITITGVGFSSVFSENSIRIGDNECRIMASNYSSITCVTPDNRANGTLELSVSVSVTDNIRTITKRNSGGSLQFDFSSDLTPTITSISPEEGQQGDTVTISGSLLEDAETVLVGSAGCVISSKTDSMITCVVGQNFVGTYGVMVTVPSLGTADGNPQFTYILRVSEMVPTEGSFAGQNILTINGVGFSPIASFVTICGQPCLPSNTPPSLTSLTCIVPSFADEVSMNTKTCEVVVESLSYNVTVPDQYTFQSSLTPTVTAIDNKRGGTAGGTTITLTGTDLGNSASVTIDGISCEVQSQTMTQITCVTGPIGRTILAQVMVNVSGSGFAIVSDDVYFYYVDVWSSRFTWGGTDPPREGDFVIVGKGQTLVLDTDTPILKILLIQGGELIFDDVPREGGIRLRSELILITDGGRLQIGTEDEPYQNQAEIIMYGNVLSTELPLFGAKTLAVRNGTVDFHGKPITNTWTKLSETVEAGSTQLKVQHDVSDWYIGGKIVLASTSYSQRENEELTIQSINDDGYTITLAEPVEYRHIFYEQTIEGRFIQTAAEVGLLTRNIVFRGNKNEEWDTDFGACEEEFRPGQFDTQTCFNGRFGSETVGDQFGAQLMFHRGPRDKVVGRLEYTEFTHVGQAFRLGRYPIHFHLNGNVSDSYVRGNGIHHTFNRAVTIHAVDYLLVEKNVAYNILGHAYFLEDGIEQGNIIQYNLGVFVRASSSLLNVDITPATYWAVNPYNIFRGNAAAGGSHFGFWYRLPQHPTGPSFTTSVRPINLPLLEFNNNTAHSFGWYGIWIFPSYYPGGIDLCNEVASPAVFSNFLAWRNNRGIEFSEVGAVQLINSTMIDNIVAGVEYTKVSSAWGKNGALVEDVLIVGHSELRTYDDQRVRGGDSVCSESGLKGPHSFYLTVSNVTFVNFDEPGCVAIRACSHCRTFQGGYETRYEKTTLVNSPNVISWNWEHEQVIKDLDGSLTGHVNGSFIPMTNTLPASECQAHSGTVGVIPGAVCTGNVQFNRFALKDPDPSSLTFRNLNVTNSHGTTELEFVLKRLEFGSGYMAILPTNTDYTLEWSGGERFTNISYNAQFSGMTAEDYFFIRHDFPRSIDYVSINGITVNASVSKPDPLEAEPGDWYTDTNDTSLTYFFKGLDTCPRSFPITFSTYRCFYEDCIPPPPPEPTTPLPPGRPSTTYKWSNTSIWPNGVVPTGENVEVTINRTYYVIVSASDVLPHFKRLTILGALEFEDDVDRVIQADLIIIDEGGRLVAGTPTNPFEHKLDFVLTGTIQALESPVYRLPNGGPVLGTKAIGVFGLLSLHGQERLRTWTFLSTTAAASSNQLTLEAPVDWKVGEEIVIASTSFEASEAEVHTISAVSNDGQTITLSANLQHEHLGGMHNTDSCSVSVSAEVGLLTRNIKITGTVPGSNDNTAYDDDYGCRVLISTYIANDGQQWTGSAQLSGVEFQDCGQEGFVETFDPRYVLAFLNIGSVVDNSSYVTDCSIHDGYNVGIGVYGTNGMSLKSNVIHNTLGTSVDLTGRKHELVDNLAVVSQFPGTYKERNDEENQEWTANFKLNQADDIVLIGNSAAGGAKCGFDTSGENCIAEGFVPQWKNNIAHSTLHGVHIGYSDGHTEGSTIGCSALHNFHIHNCYHFGIFAYSGAGGLITESTFVNNYVAIFNGVIGPAALSHDISQKTVTIANSRVIGGLHEGGTVRDCTAYSAKPEIAFHKRSHSGIQSPSGGHVGIVMTLFSSGRGGFPKFPWQISHNYPAIGGLTTLRNVTFCKFGTHCGTRKEVALYNHPSAEDAQHPVELMDTQLIDVESDSKFFNSFPKIGSINPSDCVDMDCDAYKKILIRDLDGKFTETNEGNLVTLTSNSAYEWDGDVRRGLGDYRIPRLMLAEPDGGKIDPDTLYPNKGIYRGTDNCQFNNGWNSYLCTGIDHMMMVIESLDADTEVRRLSPIGLGANDFIDLVNGPQDHGWCGGYTCQERISTFYTIIATGLEYSIGLTSTNPQDMRMIILNGVASQKIQVGLFYNSPQRLDIYVDNQYVKPTNGYFDSDGNLRYSLGSVDDFIPAITDAQGSNFYDRTYKKLYFILQGDKPVTIITSPVIQLGINLPPITVDEFFETNLIMNLALLLNIPQNRIRIVDVVSESSTRKRQAGSTRVEVEISDPPKNTVEPPVSRNDTEEYPTTYPNATRNDSSTPTPPPVTQDTEYVQLIETATQVAEVIQTGTLAKSIGYDILDASLVPPEPEVVDPTGGVRVSEGEGGPQPGDSGTDTLETFDEMQRMAEQNNTESSSTITLSIPTELRALSMATEGIEGMVIDEPIVIAMLDGIGEIVATLGYNSAWKLQAVIESGPDNGFLTNDTVDIINGRAEFTGLVFSHPGTYRIMFRTVLPADASFTLQSTSDIVIAKRDLKIYIDQQPPSEANTTFQLYPYSSISIRDKDSDVVEDLGWRGDFWYAVATLVDISSGQDYGSSIRMDLTNSSIAMFSEIKINDAGMYLIRFSVETNPASDPALLPETINSNEITVVVLPFTRIIVTYEEDFLSTVGNNADQFIEEFKIYVSQIDPSITVYNVTVSPGSIIVSFFVTASDADVVMEFTSKITTEDTLSSFTYNGVTLSLNSTVQDSRYPIIFPTDSPKLDSKYLIVVIVSVAIGSVILLALIALTCSLFCYYGTQRVSAGKKKSVDPTSQENDYEKFPMGTIYSNAPIFEDDEDYPAFHVVMDESNKLSVAKDSNSRPTSRASNSDSITKEKDVRYVSSKEIKVGDSKSITVYDQPQMTQGDFEDNMSLDELLVLPGMTAEGANTNSNNNNNNNNNNNSMISLPPAYVEIYESHPNSACDPNAVFMPPVYRNPTSTGPRPSNPPSANTRSRLTKSPLPSIEADLENGEEEIIDGLKITTF